MILNEITSLKKCLNPKLATTINGISRGKFQGDMLN
jgi:hypothetical protein